MVVDEKQLREILEERIKAVGSPREFCLKHDLDETKVSRIRRGERDFADDVLKALKARKLKTFDVPDNFVIGEPSKPRPKKKKPRFEDIKQRN